MQIFIDPADFSAQCDSWRKNGESIALVPTMGYYHRGHEELMRHARKKADRMVVSLFVNPAQFGPGEDLEAYPRNPERDCAIAREAGADAIFCPVPEGMYLSEHSTWVEVPALSSGLCGTSRPSHFRGVCTIVLKLLLLSRADIAIFGQKDWQQQAIIKRMVRDLNIPVKIETVPIVREEDGLALSSRNIYLTEMERAQAPFILQGLKLAEKLIAEGERNSQRLRGSVLAFWAKTLPLGRLDYLSIVDPESLEPLTEITGPALMACAVRLGKARLIDNILLNE